LRISDDPGGVKDRSAPRGLDPDGGGATTTSGMKSAEIGK
jgi:hypothetical protein